MPSKPCPDGALKGSRLQLRSYIDIRQTEFSDHLLVLLRAAGANYSRIDWVSPIKSGHFAEYRDSDFLRHVGVPHLEGALRKFWPENGPCWDGLAVADNPSVPNERGIILVEAKSHRLEMCGSGCGATAQESKQKIDSALSSTMRWLAASPRTPWRSHLYQYANRLAHLYFFRMIAEPKVDAWLVNVYFTDDPYRPTTKEQWADFLLEVKWALGLEPNLPFELDVYLPSIAH
jgi:hypothetical protein